MSIRLTVLCENSVERVSPAGLLGEHGFACYVQTEQGNYLFDTGGGQTLLSNSEKLQIDLQQIEGIILSHGHLDHTGGLQQVLEPLQRVPVYAHPPMAINYVKSGFPGQENNWKQWELILNSPAPRSRSPRV